MKSIYPFLVIFCMSFKIAVAQKDIVRTIDQVYSIYISCVPEYAFGSATKEITTHYDRNNEPVNVHIRYTDAEFTGQITGTIYKVVNVVNSHHKLVNTEGALTYSTIINFMIISQDGGLAARAQEHFHLTYPIESNGVDQATSDFVRIVTDCH